MNQIKRKITKINATLDQIFEKAPSFFQVKGVILGDIICNVGFYFYFTQFFLTQRYRPVLEHTLRRYGQLPRSFDLQEMISLVMKTFEFLILIFFVYQATMYLLFALKKKFGLNYFKKYFAVAFFLSLVEAIQLMWTSDYLLGLSSLITGIVYFVLQRLARLAALKVST